MASSPLHLYINDQEFTANSSLVPITQNEIWGLWCDSQGRFNFALSELTPKRWIVIDPDFLQGEVYESFQTSNEGGHYPLQYLDMVIFSNIFANMGDIILHASGVGIKNKGYCFLGNSHAGKSTIAADLAKESGVTVLGEDQVILRYQDDQFWIYGTPWHEHDDRCSAVRVPLEKLFFLDRSASQTLTSVPPSEGVLQIMQTAFIPYYRKNVIEKILARLDQLSAQVPFFTLAYQRGTDIISTLQTV